MRFLGKFELIIIIITALCSSLHAQNNLNSMKSIYRQGWIDLNKNGKMDVYENPNAPIDKRIENLLPQMTIEEKTCQLATLYGYGAVLRDMLPTPEWENEIWKDGIGNIDEQLNGKWRDSEYDLPYSRHAEAINTIQRFFIEDTRLGIPVDFTNEGIRGLCHEKATFFPAQIGQASTWNKDLVYKIGEVTAKEARALGYTNIYSPIMDLARDPRWGRTVETYGENPYLASQLGKQQVLALQKNGVASTSKHFAVYSVPIGGRDGRSRTDPHVAPREMREILLEPFRTAIQEAGGLGVMCSYNDYDGIPIAASRFFLTEILRNEWGFKGYVVSDSDALEYLYSKHRVAESYKDGVALAIHAGLNIRTTFTPPDVFIVPLREAVAEGKISMQTIDERVRDVLRVKFLLGLFDEPYVKDPEETDRIVHSLVHQEFALQAGRESIVLLKNENRFLPLKKDIKSIAVIGPNADERRGLRSRYGPTDAPIITVVEGIRSIVPEGTKVIYKKGCEHTDKNFPESDILKSPLTEEEQKMIDEAVQAAKSAEAEVVVLGDNQNTVGESRTRLSLDLPGRQFDLLKAVYETGVPVVVVLLNGRPITINWTNKYIPAIVEAWFPGEFTGRVVAEVLFGDYNPGGKLSVTFPKSVGQIPYAFPFKPGAQGRGNARVTGALYPFGHGLSYTSFEYSELKITPEKNGLHGSFEISCNVKNTGKMKGDEVIQLYINDEVSSVTTYVKVLRGFERITLEPGEEKTVTFQLTPRDLSFYNRNMEFVTEPGKFKVFVGSSSEDIRLEGMFELIKEF